MAVVVLSRIYTRTGDGGQTRLVDMSLTDKTDPRVAAYGDVDEANSQLGVLLATTELPEPMVALLGRVQNELFDLGADLATPFEPAPKWEALRIIDTQIDRLESEADRVMRAAMSKLFREQPDVRELIKLKAIYELLETITDKCEDVANLIEGVVLENA